MRKSNPRVIPKSLAKMKLVSGKIENIITKIQSTVHNIAEVREFLPFRYLYKNHAIAIRAIIGNIIEYNNI